MNFTSAAFYKLDEGTGTTVSDALGNAPDATVIGTTTNLWANADCLTVSNAQGAAGDNAIKVVDPYFDAMLRLDDLDGSSILLMYWMKQPEPPSSGTRFIMSYGDLSNNTDGGYGLQDQILVPNYSLRGGLTWQNTGLTITEPVDASNNNVWTMMGFQIDLFGGKLVCNGYMDGEPNRGARLFALEATLPRADSLGAGLRLLARGKATGTTDNYVWGQTQYKRFFLGRVNGDQRHLVPVWMKAFYDTTTGIPSFMTA